MMDWSPHMGAVFLLTIAATGWYIAARTAIGAIAGKDASPGHRALCYSLSTLLVVFISIYAGKPEIAVGVIFAGSVASLTLVLGLSVISADHTQPTIRRIPWVFVLPVGLIALLIGFRGAIGWMQAGMLLLEGAALLMMWNDLPLAKQVEDTERFQSNPSGAIATADVKPAKSKFRIMQMILAIGVAAVASWAGVAATEAVGSSLNITGNGLIAALMLAPAMILSMIGAESHVASKGQFDQAVSVVAGFVLLQLCALLPLATALWISQPLWADPIHHVMNMAQDNRPPAANGATTAPVISPATTQAATTSESPDPPEAPAPRVLPYPFAVWRVDTVLVIAVGMFLLPVALGRWSVGKIEGAALILLYGVYMILTAIMSR